ncbi:MAG TPA: hypothetical protein VNW25_00085 [Candidatus Sulfotelmatobacter sp.]|jgi:hypothetical protein|nr:hypothetical protein [Candidatus Sulfotelmatobacter sp.]
MTEKTPENDQKNTGIRLGYLKLLIPGSFWLSITILLAFFYGDSFWLWVTRAFDLSFILYTVAVIYGLYVFLPKFGAGLGGLIMTGIQGFFVKDKMSNLSQKGVEARLAKQQQQEANAIMIGDDFMKGILAEMVPSMITNAMGDALPKQYLANIEKRIEQGILLSPINMTEKIGGPVIKWVDKLLPQLKVSQSLKALGVVTDG